MKTLVIMNKRPSKVSFPYSGKNAEGKKATKWFELMPGNNSGVDAELWEKIKKDNQNDFDNYWSEYLKEIKMKGESKKVDYSAFDLGELKEYISNVVEISELVKIEKFEDERPKKRKAIVDAIKKQIKKLKEIEEKVNNK